MRISAQTTAALFFSATLWILLPGCQNKPPLQTAPTVNLERYQGKWFEIARYPNWFQRNCKSDTTATYTALPDGTIQVRNECRDKKGKLLVVDGRADVVPGSGGAKLKVSFGGPFRGDYWILGLDPEYQWAVVGHPSRQFLWLLARSPSPSSNDLKKMLHVVERSGHNSERLQYAEGILAPASSATHAK